MSTRTTQFVAGRTYYGRSPGDSNCIVTVEVISRTAKTIQAKTDKGVKTLRIRDDRGVEEVAPWDHYSMAPSVKADKEVLKPATPSDALVNVDALTRARQFFRSMQPDVVAGLRGQTDAEESAIRKLTAIGWDYDCARRAVLKP